LTVPLPAVSCGEPCSYAAAGGWARLRRLADGSASAADEAAHRAALRAWLEAPEALSLERACGVVASFDQRRRRQRNHWLEVAARLLPDRDRPWLAAVALDREWARFVSRGPWQRWRNRDCPPDDATELQKALYWATRFNRGGPLDARQLARVLTDTDGQEMSVEPR